MGWRRKWAGGRSGLEEEAAANGIVSRLGACVGAEVAGENEGVPGVYGLAEGNPGVYGAVVGRVAVLDSGRVAIRLPDLAHPEYCPGNSTFTLTEKFGA